MFGAEPWTEAMRAEIERALGLEALDIYGLGEVMGPGVSMESIEDRNGLYIWEDHFFPEVIDPDSGDVPPYGDQGELVFTSLTKRAFPVIRYRTGDVCTLFAEPGKTGRTMVRMSRVKGRTDDMLIVRGVNVFPSAVEGIVRRFAAVDEFQIEVFRTGELDEARVLVEVGSGDAAVVCAALQEALRAGLGLRLPVTPAPTRSLPRFELKARRVVRR